jgi:hypothetical protein
LIRVLIVLLWISDGPIAGNPVVVGTKCCRAYQTHKASNCGSACIIYLWNYACHIEGGDEWHWFKNDLP